MRSKLFNKIKQNCSIFSIKKIVNNNSINVKETDSDGNTLLMIAVENGCLEVTKLLVEIGININARNNHGETALELAREKKHYKIVEYLIQQGADITINNTDFSCS